MRECLQANYMLVAPCRTFALSLTPLPWQSSRCRRPSSSHCLLRQGTEVPEAAAEGSGREGAREIRALPRPEQEFPVRLAYASYEAAPAACASAHVMRSGHRKAPDSERCYVGLPVSQSVSVLCDSGYPSTCEMRCSKADCIQRLVHTMQGQAVLRPDVSAPDKIRGRRAEAHERSPLSGGER